jgi:DNA-binding SARP family transcriptional activator
MKERPYAIKIFTLGRFGIAKDGKQVKFQRKGQQKPIAMLKALIALGGREVTEEELTNILWREADGDSAHRAFAITLHRLRKLIGSEKAISFSSSKITLDSNYCYVDRWRFERLLGMADASLKNSSEEEAVQLIEKAVSMYHGPFLHGEPDEPWLKSIRKQLQSKFIRYIEALGRLYEERNEFEKAIDSFKKGIEIDHIAEGLYQRLMQCYQRLGRRAEALVVYNNLKEALSTTLGVEPSPQTAAIYKILINE